MIKDMPDALGLIHRDGEQRITLWKDGGAAVTTTKDVITLSRVAKHLFGGKK